jgi:hypothetical protein
MAVQNADAVAVTGGTATNLSGLNADGATLFVDAVNHRLGVKTATPAYDLDVAASVLGTRLSGAVGLGVPPVPANQLTTGTAPVVFGGPVGVGVSAPTRPLEVSGLTFLSSAVGIGVAPNPSYSLLAAFQSRFDGNVGILTAGAPTVPLDVNGNSRLGGPVGISVAPSGSWSLLLALDLAAKPNGGSWSNSTSSRALKQDIADLTGALATLLRLRGRTWRWADDQPELETQLPGTQTGFVLEEVGEVMPHWMQAGGTAYQERGFAALVVEALRELTGRVVALEARPS